MMSATAAPAATGLHTPNKAAKEAVIIKGKTILDVSGNQYFELIDQLVAKIRESHWEFDQVVGISRGGLTASVTVSHRFNLKSKNHRTLEVSSYDSEEEMERGEVKISEQAISTLKTLKGRILIVDDLADSGETFMKVLEEALKNKDITEIRTAAIWKKTCSKFTPTYHVAEVTGDTWIRQPFENPIEAPLKKAATP